MTALITRFAPSPTGNLHLGGARTALINYVMSKKNSDSKFYLRIEDTDKVRSKEIYTKNIIDSLTWLGLEWDSEAQIQSSRIEKHKKIADNLLNNNFAYKCICDEKTLLTKREQIIKNKLKLKKICTECKDNKNIQELSSNYAVRLKIPIEGKTSIKDTVQGNITINNQELDDYIILRKDGSPTYMLSVVVDDHDLGINYIIRGNDHFNNSFRQIYIYKFMNWQTPNYAHIPLIHGEDGAKLSKRHGAINVMELMNQGYLPDSIINNLILLGWAPKNNNSEIIKIKEIINTFNINEISKSSSIFNYDKLNYFNNYYLRLDENLKNFKIFCKNNEILNSLYNQDEEKLLRIFQVYKKNLNFYTELFKFTNIYFERNYTINLEDEFFGEVFNKNIKDFVENIKNLDSWSVELLENFISTYLKDKQIKFPIFGKPMRYILTKSYQGPSVSDILFILGKKDSLERLNQYITNI